MARFRAGHFFVPAHVGVGCGGAHPSLAGASHVGVGCGGAHPSLAGASHVGVGCGGAHPSLAGASREGLTGRSGRSPRGHRPLIRRCRHFARLARGVHATASSFGEWNGCLPTCWRGVHAAAASFGEWNGDLPTRWLKGARGLLPFRGVVGCDPPTRGGRGLPAALALMRGAGAALPVCASLAKRHMSSPGILRPRGDRLGRPVSPSRAAPASKREALPQLRPHTKR